MADRLVRRLAEAEYVTLKAGEDVIRSKIIALLTKNFEEEAHIEQLAKAEAEKLIRKGIEGLRRDEMDTRKVETLMKQKVAKDRGFVL